MKSNMRTIVTGGMIAAIIAAVAAMGTFWSRPARAQAPQTGGTAVRHITVVGMGEAKAAPDRATVQIGVQSEAKTAREALTDNNAKMAGLIDQLKKLGIQAKDIQTSNFNISPTYSQNGRTVTGYQVNNMVSVVIRDITKAGDLLDKVVNAGANTIFGMSFSIDDPKPLQTTARNAAIADARTRAQAMAQAAGVSLGQILSISETINMPPVFMAPGAMPDRGGAGGAAASSPIETGEQTITAQVQLSFELR